MVITNAVRKQWTRADFELMSRSGIFAPDERVELLEGEIIAVSPPGPEHSYAITVANNHLVRFYGQTHAVSVQNPLAIGQLSQPQPDFALVSSEVATSGYSLRIARNPLRNKMAPRRHPERSSPERQDRREGEPSERYG